MKCKFKTPKLLRHRIILFNKLKAKGFRIPRFFYRQVQIINYLYIKNKRDISWGKTKVLFETEWVFKKTTYHNFLGIYPNTELYRRLYSDYVVEGNFIKINLE